jgi:hypothetical protein
MKNKFFAGFSTTDSTPSTSKYSTRSSSKSCLLHPRGQQPHQQLSDQQLSKSADPQLVDEHQPLPDDQHYRDIRKITGQEPKRDSSRRDKRSHHNPEPMNKKLQRYLDSEQRKDQLQKCLDYGQASWEPGRNFQMVESAVSSQKIEPVKLYWSNYKVRIGRYTAHEGRLNA